MLVTSEALHMCISLSDVLPVDELLVQMLLLMDVVLT